MGHPILKIRPEGEVFHRKVNTGICVQINGQAPGRKGAPRQAGAQDAQEGGRLPPSGPAGAQATNSPRTPDITDLNLTSPSLVRPLV